MSEPASLRLARLVLGELVAAGVEHLVLSPGSRSAPLAYVCGEFPLHTTVRLDERSAAFTALGMAMASGRPAVVVTTSGSAVANLYPALTEADAAAVPLIALTADRPRRLWNTGANQTTRQWGIFEPIVRASFHIDHPDDAATPAVPAVVRAAYELAVGHLPSADIGAATAQELGERINAPGPVHINLSFDIPLTPAPSGQENTRGGGVGGAGAAHVTNGPEAGTRTTVREGDAAEQLHAFLRELPRPFVIAGDKADLTPGVSGLADLPVPVIAEPSSNLRHLPNALPGGPRILQANPELTESIGAVVTLGHPTLNRPVTALLSDTTRPQYVWCTHDRATRLAGDHTQRRAFVAVAGNAARLAPSCGPAPSIDPAPTSEPAPSFDPNWAERWSQAARALPGPTLTPYDRAALAVWEQAVAGQEQLLLGASSAIRSLDLALPGGARGPCRVWANRGLAGIDGSIATGWGIALASGQPVRLLLGDLTFLHDIASLNFGCLEEEPDLSVVVLNDAGGSIFDGLEHGELARTSPAAWHRFERYFLTPQRTDLAAAARGFGVPTRAIDVTSTTALTDLRAVLAEPVRGLNVVIVNLPPATL